MAEVTLEGVRKLFGSVTAVEDFTLSIGNGEFVVFVGPSGCGKSTTLRMLAGLEDVSSGSILIDGRAVNNIHPKDRDIAMVFQNYALYPHLNVFDNMSFGLRAKRLPRAEIESRTHEAAEILGLGDLLKRRPGELSGGQKQRVAMGRAIVRQPKVFLFDEPLSNLDAKLRHKMRAEMKLLHQRVQTTTVYVTHDQVEAMTLADRIVIMNEGRIEQVGTPDEVYKQPASQFVASFIGSPAMNFATGEISSSGRERPFCRPTVVWPSHLPTATLRKAGEFISASGLNICSLRMLPGRPKVIFLSAVTSRSLNPWGTKPCSPAMEDSVRSLANMKVRNIFGQERPSNFISERTGCIFSIWRLGSGFERSNALED